MASKTVSSIIIALETKGAEKIGGLKSSLRDLGKATTLSGKELGQLRKDILDVGKSLNGSEQSIRGQIVALEGLQKQVSRSGFLYSDLKKDIAALKSELFGLSQEAQKQSSELVKIGLSSSATASQIQKAIKGLRELRGQATQDSQAFFALTRDIDNLTGSLSRLQKNSEEQKKENALLVGGLRKTAGQLKLQSRVFAQRVEFLQKELDALDLLTKKEKELTANKEKRARVESDLAKRSRESIQIRFLSSVAEGRKQVIALASAFNDADRSISGFNKRLEFLDENFGKIPDTAAGVNQELRELQERFYNTSRSAENYVVIALQVARVQREASAATQGLGAALVDDLASGVAARSQRNLREAIGQLQSEMAELNVTTSEGSAQYARKATQVNKLQKELDQIANSYRNVGDAARQASAATGASGLNPFGASGGRSPAYAREKEKQEMEQIAQLQKEIDSLSDEYANSVRSALQTIQEFRARNHDQLMSQIAEEDSAQKKAFQEQQAAEDAAFQAELRRRDVLLQAQKAAASALGLGGREDISSLYQGIIGLSTADIRRQKEMMGKSATEVFNDIATAFEKGGRAVDLKGKSTDIGDDIAEGVVDGASKSSEINKGARDFASRLIAAYKRAFKIKSPSKETEQKIGIPLGLGIIKGLISALRANKREVQKEIEQIIEPPIPRSRQPRRLIGTVQDTIAVTTGPSRVRATRARAATAGYRPLQSNVRLDSEIERMFNQFRVNIAAVTTDAEIYYNLLQSLPSSRITTDLADLASRRARAAEVPGFMAAQRQIGPGDLERAIASSVAESLKGIRAPDPWVGVIGDYNKFIDSIVKKTQELIRLREYLDRFTVSSQNLLTGTRIAGALPPSRMGYAADPSRVERISRLGEVRALPPAQRRFGELARPDIAMFEPEGTAREYQKMARLLAEASSDLAAAKRSIKDVGFQNLPVEVTGLRGAALTSALLGYSRQARGLPSADVSAVRGIFPGTAPGFRGGIQSGVFDFGGQKALPPTGSQLALPSAEMRKFNRDIEFEFRKLKAKMRGGSEGEHFMGSSGGGRYTAGSIGAGGGGGGRGFVGAGSAGGAFDKLNQVLRAFGPLSDRSAADVRELGASLRGLQDIISPLDADFEQVNQAIDKQSRLIDRELQKRERQRNRRRMSPMQMTQAAGAVLSGGIFGGPEGFLGGAIGAIGGVGGAFAGAAIGAQVGGIRRTLGEYADYAAEIKRLEIALKGITEVQDDAVASQANYSRAVAAAADVTKDLNVPQEVAIRGITRLTAAVKGAGGGVADAELAFKNITSAITATGGGAEQVQGAVTALVQIFSKGKVSAEEINQIAERLPGTFNKIAEASGRTGPELTKALQKGEVGLNDLMKFLVQLGGEYGELAEKIAGSSEAAGQRLQVAYNNMRIEVGNALRPIGAEFQDAFTEFIEDITPSLIGAAKSVGEGLRLIIQNKDAIAVAASLALKVAAVNIALKAFAALNGPISTMFVLLKSGFKASSQQAALAQGKLIAFGTTVKALAASLAAPLVITFAVVGAEMVISYFNRIKKARADLEATAQKPQGEVFFRSIGGTAATKETLQRNINDITKNLDILRGRVKSTKDEIASYNRTVDSLDSSERALGGAAPPSQTAVPEDLTTRLQADEAEIKRLVLNYRTLVDKYLDAPDKPALTVFEKPDATGGGTGGGAGDKGPKSQLEQLKAQYESIMRSSKGVLEIEKMRQQQALQLARATADNNQKLITTTNLNNISLDFAEQQLQLENKLLDDLDNAAALEIKADRLQAEKNAQLEYEIKLSQLLEKSKGAIALEEQRAAIAAEERQKALADQVFSLRDQLGLVTDDERIDRYRAQLEQQYGADDPRAAEATDLFRQTVAPTFAEGLGQKIRELKEDLEGLVNPINQITFAANTIGTAFSQSFGEVITGSKSIKEALSDAFASIGKAFIDMATQIIAKQLVLITLGTIMKALGIAAGAGSGANPNSANVGSVLDSGGFTTGNMADQAAAGTFAFGRANGGPVNANQPYIVGERGPELFIPFQQGNITSNEELKAQMRETRSAPMAYTDRLRETSSASMAYTDRLRETREVMLPFTRSAEQASMVAAERETAQAISNPGPIDVRYESTVVNGVEYVTAEQHQAGMAQAAERGRALTLQALQNSVKSRRKIGL